VRFIGIVFGSVLLALIIVVLQVARPGAASAGEERRSLISERITWLWAPPVRRTVSLP
jgi:hypothetical protein